VVLPKDPPIIIQEGDSDELMKLSSPHSRVEPLSTATAFSAPLILRTSPNHTRGFTNPSREPPALNQPDYSRFLSLTPEPALFGTQGS